jgi:crotonobetainyl-CoA:carnitine CoA-transferase CaiB-like acyl-CoA transferase
MSLTGEPDSPPTKSGLSLVDLSGGYVAALAILAGLWRARREGTGCDCDISLFETALSELAYVGTWAASHGYQPPRRANSAHPSIVPFGNFPTADGWIVIAAPKQHFWVRLCHALGLEGLAEDPRFVDFAARDRNREQLVALLSGALAAHTTERWLEILGDAGVPCAPVNDLAGALADRQTVARGDVQEIKHPSLGVVRQIASPLRVCGPPARLRRAPRRGEHTEEVLVRLGGYGREEIDALAEAGAFGEQRGISMALDPGGGRQR